MSLKKQYLGIKKLNAGPGGCHPRNMKHLARRRLRRINKQLLVP